MNFYKKSQKGFSLIEIIVVIAILGMIASLGLFISMDFYKTYSFRQERTTIVSVLQKTRNLSLSNINESTHGVYFDGNNYTIFQGTGYGVPNHDFDQVFEASHNISMEAFDASNNPVSFPLSVVFSQLSGNSSYVRLKITDSTGRNGNITISESGQIDW